MAIISATLRLYVDPAYVGAFSYRLEAIQLANPPQWNMALAGNGPGGISTIEIWHPDPLSPFIEDAGVNGVTDGVSAFQDINVLKAFKARLALGFIPGNALGFSMKLRPEDPANEGGAGASFRVKSAFGVISDPKLTIVTDLGVTVFTIPPNLGWTASGGNGPGNGGGPGAGFERIDGPVGLGPNSIDLYAIYFHDHFDATLQFHDRIGILFPAFFPPPFTPPPPPNAPAGNGGFAGKRPSEFSPRQFGALISDMNTSGLAREDLPDAPPGVWLDDVLRVINTNSRSHNNVVQGGIGTDNMGWEYKEAQFDHGKPLTLSSDKVEAPKGLIVLSSKGHRVVSQELKPVNGATQVTLHFADTSARGVKTGVLLLPNGTASGDAVSQVQAWQPVTFQNAWVDSGAPNAPVGFRKTSDNRVHLRGLANAGVVPSVAFTLPVGSRPENSLAFCTVSNGALGIVGIAADGTVTVVTGNNLNFFFDGISFFADQ